MSNLFKKVTSTVGAIAIAVSSVGATLTVSAASNFAPYADALATAGIISKQSAEAGYRLGDSITRAEMAKIAVNMKGAAVAACTGKVYSDVTSSLGDLCGYVEAAANAGIVSKTAAKFRPMDLVTRAEMVKMLLGAKGIAATTVDAGFKDIAATGDLAGYINAAAAAGIIQKSASFNPNNTATRGEAFKVASNSAGLTTSSNDELNLGDLFGTGTTTTTNSGNTSTTTTVAAAGNLEVALNPASPASGAQIPKVGIVRFAVVDFTAGGSDISLNSVELKKAGLASIPTSTRVWFEKNGTRLSGKAAFSSDNSAIVSFAPAYVVKAGSTESLDMYVDLNTTSGNDFQFTSGVVASSALKTTGSFTTNTLRTADYSTATASVTVGGSDTSYNASADAVELAKFTIANTDTNSDTRDIKVQSILLYQNGNGNLTNLSNIVVERNGVVVSSGAVVSGKTLALNLNDVIKDGSSAIYTVKAVINNVDLSTGDTYQFYVKNVSDLNIVETATAYRAVVSTASATPYNFKTYTVTGGDVKFERDSSVALSSTVAPGTDNVVLMQGTVTAKSAVTLEDLTLGYTTTAGSNTGAITQMNTVYLQIGTSTFSWTPANGAATFLGTATVSGTVPVKMYTKLKDTASGTIKFNTLDITGFATKQYVANQNNVTSGVGNVSGVTVTVGATTLNVTRTDGLGTTQLPSGAKGVLVYGARFSSTQGNAIALSNLTATTTGDALSYTGGNTSLTLYVNGVAKSTKALNTASVSFDNFNAIVSSSASVDIQIKADFSDVTTSGAFQVASIGYDAVDNVTSQTVAVQTVAGATFNIATAQGALAATTGDNIVNRSLLQAGATAQKLVSFKVTASNDTIKLKTIVLTGANLGAVSNIRLADSALNVVQSASSVTTTGATFANLDTVTSTSNTIAQDKSATYYVIADINSSTDAAGVQANVAYTGSQITGSNGSVIAMAGTNVTGAAHDVAQNTFKVAQTAPTSKDIATDAMEFTVNAFGKNSVTLTGATFNNLLSGYDVSSAQLSVYRKSDNALVGAVAGTGTTGVVTFTANNSIDAGSSATYVVKIVGAVVSGSSTSQGWTVSLTSLNVNTGVNVLDAANYPKNTDTLPLTSNK